MFTADFFRTALQKHITEKATHSAEGGSATVELYLQFDIRYVINRIVEALDDALVVEVYPEKGSARKNPKAARELGAPLFDLDRVAIAYSTINRVVITTRRMTKDAFGFQASTL